jgi:iron complex outermembrane receptor protein
MGAAVTGWLVAAASLSVYRSTVEGIPGPDNRLEGQQPWSANLGFDHSFAGTPLSLGGNASRTPACAVQQTVAQRPGPGPGAQHRRLRDVDLQP